MKHITCPECGQIVDGSAKSCPNCGEPFDNIATEEPVQQHNYTAKEHPQSPSITNVDNFPLLDGERIICYAKPNKRFVKLLLWILTILCILIVLCAAFGINAFGGDPFDDYGYGGSYSDGGFWPIFISIIIYVLILWLFWGFFMHRVKASFAVITNKRVVAHWGLFFYGLFEMTLDKLESIQILRPCAKAKRKTFNFGIVTVWGIGAGRFRLFLMDDPDAFRQQFYNALGHTNWSDK